MKKIVLILLTISLYGKAQDTTCFNIPDHTGGEVAALNDDATTPGGSVILSDIGIDIIIPNDGFGIYPAYGTQIDYITGGEIGFINQLDMAVSGLPYDCKRLTFNLFYNGMAVDDDTVFIYSPSLPALPYSGSGFTLDTITAGYYIVEGVFDTIHIFGSTSILSDICVEECPATGCFTIPELSGPEVADLNNDALYPAGSTILSDMGINIIIPNDGVGIYPMNGTQIDYVSGGQIGFINQLDLDVSEVPFPCKELTFSLLYNGIAVDEDTVFISSPTLPALPYMGTGFTLDTLSAEYYVISGAFDTIHIFGSTSILKDICIDECIVEGVVEAKRENLIRIYPNPAHGIVYFEHDSEDQINVEVFTIEGKKIDVFRINNMMDNYQLDQMDKGIYLFKFTTGQQSHTQRLVVE